MKIRKRVFRLAFPFNKGRPDSFSFEITFPTRFVIDTMDPGTEDAYTRIIFLVLGFGFYYDSFSVYRPSN